jgi:hypothetical protein
MTALSIRGMNWEMGQRELIRDAQMNFDGGIPMVTKRTPEEEIKLLEEKIHNERLFIAKYKCNYKRLASEAYGRIKYYRNKIKEIREGE